MATLMGMTPQMPQYRMTDLSAPMSVASMQIPDITKISWRGILKYLIAH